MKLVDLTLFLKPAGEILFDIQIHHQTVPVESIVMAIIGFLYFIMPTGKIINIINPQMFHPEEKSYQLVKESFKDTYHTLHPILKIIRAEKLRKVLKKRGLILSTENRLNTTENNLAESELDQFSMPYNYNLNSPKKQMNSNRNNNMNSFELVPRK